MSGFSARNARREAAEMQTLAADASRIFGGSQISATAIVVRRAPLGTVAAQALLVALSAGVVVWRLLAGSMPIYLLLLPTMAAPFVLHHGRQLVAVSDRGITLHAIRNGMLRPRWTPVAAQRFRAVDVPTWHFLHRTTSRLWEIEGEQFVPETQLSREVLEWIAAGLPQSAVGMVS